MAGVLFVVCIPTSVHEKKLRKSVRSPEKNVAFNFNVTKSISDEDVANQKPQKVDSLSCENVFDGENSSLLKPKSTFVFIDEDASRNGSLLSVSKPAAPVQGVGVDGHHMTKSPTLLDLPEEDDRSMEQHLEKTLKTMKIENAVWNTVKGGNFYQVTFSVSAELCEETLCMLDEWGIGASLNSIVSVIPCSVFYDGLTHAASEDDVAQVRASKAQAQTASTWDKFVASVGARLTVAQVVERVKADARLTFDFLVLLLMAGAVATLGLIENSTVVLVASMLISPLMGPIMAGTFGFVVEDRRLRKMGVRNELAGLSICLLVGFGIGLVVGVLDDYTGSGQLPTEEMLSRGKVRALWVGALIALPSGAAVAIALLGDKTGSLVGVAISASILPPAVNAGLLWALAVIRLAWQKDNGEGPVAQAHTEYVYSEDLSCELAVLGAVSLCLTLVNILCIFLMGILVLKIKEVAPRTSGKQSQFWRHDIKIARDYNKTVNKEDGKLLQKQLADELAGFVDADLSAHHISPERIMNISNRLLPRNQQTWSPSVRPAESRMSLQELEDLYLDLTGSQRAPVRRSHSLMPQEPSSAAAAAWYRPLGHLSPETGRALPPLRGGVSFDAGAPARRMTYSSHEAPGVARHAQRRRFVVSPVEEAPPGLGEP